MPCTANVASEDYADFITRYYTSPEEFMQSQDNECIDFVTHDLAVLYAPLDAVRPLSLSTYTYSAIPKLYSLLDSSSMEASGISGASRLSALANAGSGVLIGLVDTGIDYTNPLFRNPDGSTRLLGIWDQTSGNGNVVPGNTFRWSGPRCRGAVWSRRDSGTGDSCNRFPYRQGR